MTDNSLSHLLFTNPVVGCRFEQSGKIVHVEGSFLDKKFTPGVNIYTACDFLVGTIEQLEVGKQMDLTGIHLIEGEAEFIVDCMILRERDDSFVLVIDDETQRYHAVNQLSQERNQADIMHHQLARQNDQLVILKDAAESSARTRTEFLAKMSHEIRTPLNALIGFSEMLSDSDLGPDQSRHVKNIHTAGNALSGLLNDILDLSRIESGKYQIDEAPFSLVPMLEDVMSLCQPRAKEKAVEFVLEMGDSLPERVIGDKVRLSQIVLNLLTNAIKFTDQGSVTLRVTAAESTDTSELLIFEVEDTGRGIPKEQQKEIFERFSQSRVADATVLGGIGLGLAIVRQLVDAMGGTISVTSEVGKGATFTFKLGLKRALKGQLASRVVDDAADKESLLEGKCILVAEDSKLNQQFVADVLTARGCRLIPVETGTAAIQAVLAEPVDLVLMDVMMPELTGDEAIKQIRNDFLFPLNSVPIVTFSGKASKEEQAKFIDIGATDSLPKPFSAASLVDKISAVFSNTEKYIDAQIEQRISDDVSPEMVEIFKADVPGYLRGLLNALYTQNEKQFIFQAHKLQSAMWVMEFMELYEILARLENEVLSFAERLDLCREVCSVVEQSLTGPTTNH